MSLPGLDRTGRVPLPYTGGAVQNVLGFVADFRPLIDPATNATYVDHRNTVYPLFRLQAPGSTGPSATEPHLFMVLDIFYNGEFCVYHFGVLLDNGSTTEYFKGYNFVSDSTNRDHDIRKGPMLLYVSMGAGRMRISGGVLAPGIYPSGEAGKLLLQFGVHDSSLPGYDPTANYDWTNIASFGGPNDFNDNTFRAGGPATEVVFSGSASTNGIYYDQAQIDRFQGAIENRSVTPPRTAYVLYEVWTEDIMYGGLQMNQNLWDAFATDYMLTGRIARYSDLAADPITEVVSPFMDGTTTQTVSAPALVEYTASVPLGGANSYSSPVTFLGAVENAVNSTFLDATSVGELMSIDIDKDTATAEVRFNQPIDPNDNVFETTPIEAVSYALVNERLNDNLASYFNVNYPSFSPNKVLDTDHFVVYTHCDSDYQYAIPVVFVNKRTLVPYVLYLTSSNPSVNHLRVDDITAVSRASDMITIFCAASTYDVNTDQPVGTEFIVSEAQFNPYILAVKIARYESVGQVKEIDYYGSAVYTEPGDGGAYTFGHVEDAGLNNQIRHRVFSFDTSSAPASLSVESNVLVISGYVRLGPVRAIPVPPAGALHRCIFVGRAGSGAYDGRLVTITSGTTGTTSPLPSGVLSALNSAHDFSEYGLKPELRSGGGDTFAVTVPSNSGSGHNLAAAVFRWTGGSTFEDLYTVPSPAHSEYGSAVDVAFHSGDSHLGVAYQNGQVRDHQVTTGVLLHEYRVTPEPTGGDLGLVTMVDAVVVNPTTGVSYDHLFFAGQFGSYLDGALERPLSFPDVLHRTSTESEPDLVINRFFQDLRLPLEVQVDLASVVEALQQGPFDDPLLLEGDANFAVDLLDAPSVSSTLSLYPEGAKGDQNEDNLFYSDRTFQVPVPAGSYSIEIFERAVNAVLYGLAPRVFGASYVQLVDFAWIKSIQGGALLSSDISTGLPSSFRLDFSLAPSLQSVLGVIGGGDNSVTWSAISAEPQTVFRSISAGYNFEKVRTLYLETNFTRGGMNPQRNPSQILASIPVDVQPGQTIRYQPSVPLRIDAYTGVVGDSSKLLEFRLVDEEGRPVPMPLDTQWSVSVLIEWEQDIDPTRLLQSQTESKFA